MIAPAEELVANPIPNAIALFSLEQVAKGEAQLPKDALRMAVSVRGEPCLLY